MRRFRFTVIGIITFLATLLATFLVPGTVFNRVLSAAICTIFSLNSYFCPANLAKASTRVVAANPPGWEILQAQRDPGEFGGEPSSPPVGNAPVPPYPQQPGPNVPVRPDFDSTRGTTFSQIGNNIYEINVVTPNGCKVTRVINILEDSPYLASVQLEPVNLSLCQTGFWLFRFQPDNHNFEIVLSQNESILVEFKTESIATVIHKSYAETETYEISYKNIIRDKIPASTKKRQNNNNLISLSGEININLDDSQQTIISQDLGDSWANSLGCEVCSLWQPIKEKFDLASKIDDLLGMLASLPFSLQKKIWSHAYPDIQLSRNSAVNNYVTGLLEGPINNEIKNSEISTPCQEFCKNQNKPPEQPQPPQPNPPEPQPQPRETNPSEPQQTDDCLFWGRPIHCRDSSDGRPVFKKLVNGQCVCP